METKIKNRVAIAVLFAFLFVVAQIGFATSLNSSVNSSEDYVSRAEFESSFQKHVESEQQNYASKDEVEWLNNKYYGKIAVEGGILIVLGGIFTILIIILFRKYPRKTKEETEVYESKEEEIEAKKAKLEKELNALENKSPTA